MRKHGPRPHPRKAHGTPPLRLYGRHAVLAALANPRRLCLQLSATTRALAVLAAPPNIEVRVLEDAALDRLLPTASPHQGLVLEVEPLEAIRLEDVLAERRPRPLVMLDQVTDPQNLGAILRSAAAFDAAAVITQDRHSPEESGALAKAASGALELVPWCRVVNLARALDQIAEAGWWRVALDGDAPLAFAKVVGESRLCLVMGAEGAGVRPNVLDHTDVRARLPISPRVESLNVSTATAIALYATVTAATTAAV